MHDAKSAFDRVKTLEDETEQEGHAIISTLGDMERNPVEQINLTDANAKMRTTITNTFSSIVDESHNLIGKAEETGESDINQAEEDSERRFKTAENAFGSVMNDTNAQFGLANKA